MIDTAPPGKYVSASLLLPTQLVFNLGFYAVVPFLALVMTDDFGLGAAAVGLVLGARTFSQQGMFLLGGVIADHWGPRRSILTGCIVRAAGYLGLATSESFWPFLLSAVLTGIGGAFFSPAVDGLIGALDRDQVSSATRDGTAASKRPGRNLFAWLVLFGEIGAVTGPLIGIGLLPFGFPLVAISAACLFLAVGFVLWLLLPEHNALVTTEAEPAVDGPAVDPPGMQGGFACLRDRRFVGFAAFFSVNLLAYNQLYFALPLELKGGGSGTGMLAVLFTLASVLTIALQLPISAMATRLGPATALRAGFACIASGFAAIAVMGSTGIHLAPGLSVMIGPIVLVVLLSLGHMLAGPAGMQQVHGFAGLRPLSAYYGLLASCGGLAVLVGNSLIGGIRDTLGSPSGWVLLVLLAAATAVFLPRFLPIVSVLPAVSAYPPVSDQKVQP